MGQEPTGKEPAASSASSGADPSQGWPTWDQPASAADDSEPDAAPTAPTPVAVGAGSSRDVDGDGPKARNDEVLAFIDEPPPRRRRLVLIGALSLVAAGIIAAVVIPRLGEGTAVETVAGPTVADEAESNPTVAAAPTAPAVPSATAAPTATAEPSPTPAPTSTPAPTAAPTAVPTTVPESADGDPPEVAGVTIENAQEVASAQTPAGADLAPAPEPTPEPVAVGEVPESKAVVLGGKIYLEGAVPDEASAQAIVDLAAAILGPDNVVNNYVIDPRAGDPNLGNIRVDDTVLFATNSDVIAAEFEPLLGQALALMSLRPSVTLTIVGHTDSVGRKRYNKRLSVARAESVIDWLTERGVDPARLTAVGAGETDPIATNETPEGRQLNRRIQVFIENLLADE